MISRLNHSLRSGSFSQRIEQLLGCNKRQCPDWISFNLSRVCSGKTTEHWKFDHVTTLSSYDLANKTERLVACHWRNLRPCIKHDNQTKSHFI